MKWSNKYEELAGVHRTITRIGFTVYKENKIRKKNKNIE